MVADGAGNLSEMGFVGITVGKILRFCLLDESFHCAMTLETPPVVDC